MSVNWYNPYAAAYGEWYRGNLHAHCLPGSPCATIGQENLLKGYRQKGYDFLAISDHLAVTRAQAAKPVMIFGLEWNSRTPHMSRRTQTQQNHVGIYGIDRKAVENTLECRALDELAGAAGDMLFVANHPDWLDEEHYSLTTLMRFAHLFDGLEIYNHSIEADPGQADSTWKWDKLLSSGFPILGFAHDDSHAAADIGRAWLMVKALDNTPKSLLRSLKTGNFYSTTGVVIESLERRESTISIRLAEEAVIRVVGSFGRVMAESVGTSMHWNFEPQKSEYARFHVRNSLWQQGWSQPFYRL